MVAVKLKKEWVEKLRPPLIKALEGAQTSHGMFLDRSSMPVELIVADVLIPDKSPVRTTLESYVGEFPLAEFVNDVLSQELYDRDDYQSDRDVIPLTEIEGYADPAGIADGLIASIQNLPWKYTISIGLPAELGECFPADFDRCDVGPHLRLIRGGAELEELLPLSVPDEKLMRRIRGKGILAAFGDGPKWAQDTIYLVGRTNGFIGPYGNSPPHREVVAKFKAFFGLLIALRAVKLSAPSYGPGLTSTLYVHKIKGESAQPDNRLDFPDSASAILRRLTAFDNDGKMTDESAKKNWFRARLNDAAKIFSSGSHSERLILAGQWFFESQSHGDPLLAYIRTMVVLEILLGTQKGASEMSIGDTIANRCAFLIGSDFGNREEILRDFKKIYAVRSQIVHRGKSELRLEEQTMLRKLQWMARRVIQEEVTKIPSK